jgi:ABC-type lipoprotein release transport system permease subunit
MWVLVLQEDSPAAEYLECTTNKDERWLTSTLQDFHLQEQSQGITIGVQLHQQLEIKTNLDLRDIHSGCSS